LASIGWQVISGPNIARIALLVALFGFVLPWVLVSCSGQPLGHFSGLELALGASVRNPATGAVQHQNGDLLAATSLAAAIAGIVVGLVARGRLAIAGMLAAAVIGLVASGVSVSRIAANAQAEAQSSDRPADPSLRALLRVELQYGYFVTAGALLTAIGACALALNSGREPTRAGRPSGQPP
jgi:hypothetical protein